jgi:ABC-type multidrug transport system ATPase subunit
MSLVSLWGITLERAGRVLLDHVSLSVEAGEIVVVTGARGAGTSSLLAIAAGAVVPGAGEVVIGGRSVTGLQAGSRPYLRRNIGYLPAEPPFVRDETALENVLLPLAARGADVSAAEADARRALAALDVEALAERTVGSLSAPERRLVALARALCGPPAVVVLDEPSLGLDDHDRARLMDALVAARAQDTAILCGTSDATLTAALSSWGARVTTLSAGRLPQAAPALRLVPGTSPTDASPTQPSENSPVFSATSTALEGTGARGSR